MHMQNITIRKSASQTCDTFLNTIKFVENGQTYKHFEFEISSFEIDKHNMDPQRCDHLFYPNTAGESECCAIDTDID